MPSRHTKKYAKYRPDNLFLVPRSISIFTDGIYIIASLVVHRMAHRLPGK